MYSPELRNFEAAKHYQSVEYIPPNSVRKIICEADERRIRISSRELHRNGEEDTYATREHSNPEQFLKSTQLSALTSIEIFKAPEKRRCCTKKTTVMADKKALFRAKLAQRKEKRIENPLVRYNEHDQPVCRVCDVVLKSETDWTVHQASRKHNAAINNLKANAAALKQTNNVKPALSKEPPRPKPVHHEELHNKEAGPSAGLSKPRQASSLPPNFFDSKETKKQKSADLIEPRNHESRKDTAVNAQTEKLQPPISRNKVDITNENVDSKSSEFGPSREQIAKETLGSEARKAKGVLPEGFYDNKDADLRARGITPVKPDVKDEYKEFEKLIQEDLKEVDKRLEEEEYDAADMIEEAETVEQRAYRERVEMLKKKNLELKVAKSTIKGKGTQLTKKESSDDESSSEVDSDENLTVDWRAKHL